MTYASNIKYLKSNRNISIYKIDINNRKKIRNIIKKYQPSSIFNLAAETHVDRSIDGPDNFIKSNILGVFNLLEVLRNHKEKIKLIFHKLALKITKKIGLLKVKKAMAR